MIREQEVVKNEQGPTQGPTRSVDQLVREHYPRVVFPKEAGQLVRARYQGVCERIRREQGRPGILVGDRERGDDGDDSVSCALGLDPRTTKNVKS